MSTLPLPTQALPFMPHEPPMALIDEIVYCDAHRIVTRVYLNDDHLFAEQGRVPAWVGIELMAQSAAAWSGFNAQLARQNDSAAVVPIGYLLGTRDYQVTQTHFMDHAVLEIHATCLLQSSEGLGSFDCQIFDQNAILLAKARLSVFQPSASLDAHE